MPSLTEQEINDFIKQSSKHMSAEVEKRLRNMIFQESNILSPSNIAFGSTYRTKEEQEEKFLNRYAARPTPPLGQTLDQRFNDLEDRLTTLVKDQIKKATDHLTLHAVNQVDFHMGEVETLVKELQETVADIRMEWDEFQEDEGR